MLLKIVFFSSQYFFYRLSSFFCLSQFFSFSHKSFSISRVISQRFFFSVQLTSQRKTQELSQKIYMNNFFLLFCFEEFFTLPLSISSEYKFAREKKTTTLNNQKPRFTSGERAEKRKKINFCIRVIDKLLQWSKKFFGNYFLISFGIRKIFCYFQHNFNHNQMKFLLLFFSSTIYSFFNFLSFYSYSEHTQKKLLDSSYFDLKYRKKIEVAQTKNLLKIDSTTWRSQNFWTVTLETHWITRHFQEREDGENSKRVKKAPRNIESGSISLKRPVSYHTVNFNELRLKLMVFYVTFIEYDFK